MSKSPMEKTCAELLATCEEFGANHICIVLRNEKKKPLKGIFCINNGPLAEIVEQAIADFEEDGECE